MLTKTSQIDFDIINVTFNTKCMDCEVSYLKDLFIFFFFLLTIPFCFFV